jgi:hypothetical protein
MTRSRQPGGNRRMRHLLVLALLSLALLLGPAASVQAQNAADGPTLVSAAATFGVTGGVTIAGEGFTPGGWVYLAIYDQMGATLHETRWTVASRAAGVINFAPGLAPEAHPIAAASINFVPGLAPEAHPVLAPVRGGTVREAFAGLCGVRAMTRAYDAQTGVWSNWLDVTPGC